MKYKSLFTETPSPEVFKYHKLTGLLDTSKNNFIYQNQFKDLKAIKHESDVRKNSIINDYSKIVIYEGNYYSTIYTCFHKKELNRRIENIDKFSKPFEKLVHEAQTKYNVSWFCY